MVCCTNQETFRKIQNILGDKERESRCSYCGKYIKEKGGDIEEEIHQ